SILGLTLSYNSLDSRLRPTRGRSATVSVDLAGLGGSTRYVRARGDVAQFFNLGSGFISSLRLEGGYIMGWGSRDPGESKVLLTDRFFLGEGQMRGFDIRGV